MDSLKRIDQSLTDWSMKLDKVLSEYETACKTPISSSHCQVIYGKACHLQVKLEHKELWVIKLLTIDASLASLERKYQVLQLE